MDRTRTRGHSILAFLLALSLVFSTFTILFPAGSGECTAACCKNAKNCHRHKHLNGSGPLATAAQCASGCCVASIAAGKTLVALNLLNQLSTPLIADAEFSSLDRPFSVRTFFYFLLSPRPPPPAV